MIVGILFVVGNFKIKRYMDFKFGFIFHGTEECKNTLDQDMKMDFFGF